jgi:putative phosphoribosyl transferase
MTTKMESNIQEVTIGPRRLPGILSIPEDARGLILFAHGSGSSRLSKRNQYVARVLQESKLATLLFDLLDKREAEDRRQVFDIELLADRLADATDWVRQRGDCAELPLGYFGASTGAAAALVAAARQARQVSAIVSRGGRPDLAEPYLGLVEAPTLLVVGGNDEPVIEMNQRALELLRCDKQLTVVPGATHLFPEPGALEIVAGLASDWFRSNLLARCGK